MLPIDQVFRTVQLIVPALKAIYRAKNAEAGLKALAEFETSFGMRP